MGCGCRKRKGITVFEVEMSDGTIKRVLTMGEVDELRDTDPNLIYRKVAR
ncbi:hypothetical protein SEA_VIACONLECTUS_21 [Gordonia phage ViaConlectus]|uniref:Uncharacterized protein n=2 Tax=Zitchvirus TaxID=2948963 RepID=A0A976U9P7_9CAUD|nr:hypothetical protein SEA_APUNK_22 [Gordonia phage APunk]UVG34984.1 hypothetical protein SEA_VIACONLECTUS_21 [Gordonia phage ViaConlectus]